MAVLCGLLVTSGTGRAVASRHPRSGAGVSRPFNYCGHRRAVFRGTKTIVGVYAQLGDRGLADLECTTGRIAAGHLGYVRDELSWASVEVSPGQYYWTDYDQIMTALAAHHLSWLPVVEVAPTFYERYVRTRNQGIFPPDPRPFAQFLKVLVRRYGPHGSFWRAHPTLPYYPVRAWQIWNEPSLQSYWLPRPSPAGYTALLRASWRAIKSVDRHAVVVAAGMPFSTGLRFYNQMYRAGARRYFDVAAFHDYSIKVENATQYLTMLRALMNRHRDAHKPIWVTEFGWASSGPPSPFRAGRAAPRLDSRLIQFMVSNRKPLRLDRFFYYNWRDPATTPVNWWGVNMGLFRPDSTPRAAASAIISAAARLNR